jgi:ABC-type transport system involved in cytochrome c biogenesis permease subunit
MPEGAMRLTSPTKPIFYLSVVLGVWALVIYFVSMIGVIEGSFHAAFWIAIAAWLAMTVGVVFKGI